MRTLHFNEITFLLLILVLNRVSVEVYRFLEASSRQSTVLWSKSQQVNPFLFFDSIAFFDILFYLKDLFGQPNLVTLKVMKIVIHDEKEVLSECKKEHWIYFILFLIFGIGKCFE
jgi:hypothetical protein